MVVIGRPAHFCPAEKMAQMPSGMPVATVAIDGAVNAALLAAQILGVTDQDAADRLSALRRAQTEKVLMKDQQFSKEYSYSEEA